MSSTPVRVDLAAFFRPFLEYSLKILTEREGKLDPRPTLLLLVLFIRYTKFYYCPSLAEAKGRH